MIWLGAGLVLVALTAFGYWLFVIAEGTYLGPRVVSWTYDLVARRYDAIKQFVFRDESLFVIGPLLNALDGVESPLLLDVATGTGRVPIGLLRLDFQGQIIGLDLSMGMLRQARNKLAMYGAHVGLLWQDASRLPFDSDTFDAVSCLESLEFMPKPMQVLSEMVRVLTPGGVLLVTNRVGYEARLLPRRTLDRPSFERALESLPLHEIDIRGWQVQYDLAIARKIGAPGKSGCGDGAYRRSSTVDLASLVCCPSCAGSLEGVPAGLSCSACERTYHVEDGIVELARPKE